MKITNLLKVFIVFLLLQTSTVNVLAQSSAQVSIDAGQSLGILPRYERVNNQIVRNKFGTADNNLLRDVKTDLVRTFVKGKNISNAKGSYSFSYYYPVLDDIVSYGGRIYMSFEGVPEWLATVSTNPNCIPNTYGPPNNYTDFEQFVYDTLKHYKIRYGDKFEYYEVWNEPNDGSKCKPVKEDYVKIYLRAHNAVRRVNQELSAHVPIKLGGPATYWFDTEYIQYVLNYIDTNNLQLDFVAWHDYSHRTNPADFVNQISQARSWLTSRGLSAEIFISEWNLRGISVIARDMAISASFMTTGVYYWLEGNNINKTTPMFWVIRHTQPGSEYLNELHESVSGKVYPFYNVLKMMSMLKTNRIPAVSNGANSYGLGVNAIATKDSGGIAVMVWNYQNGNSTSVTTNLSISNLPSEFRSGNIQYQKYLIDAQHSNYLYNSSSDKLEKISDTVLSGRNSYSESLTLGRDSVYLLVFIPSGTASTVTPTPCIKQGDANGDCRVDGYDYVVWWQNFGRNVSGGPSQGDFNNSGFVDGYDYVIWWMNFGR